MRFATADPTGKMLLWQLKAIPFGWDKACYLGQTTHQDIVNKVNRPQGLCSNLYIDDGLAMGTPAASVTSYTADITTALKEEGFHISDKSHLLAAPSQDYIGKTYANQLIKNTMTE